MTTSRKPPSFDPRPAVDERLVVPGQGCEVLDGEVVEVSPSDEPHGRRQSKLSALLEVHVGPNWLVAADMLTRTSKLGDIAPDASVYPLERDANTGGRQLEALAFEVCSSQTRSDSAKKAARLVERGVRRVFAIDVRREQVLEWSAASESWRELDADGTIDDPVFAVPLPIRSLVTAAAAGDVIAEALLATGNPVLEAALAIRFEDGESAGLAEALRQVMAGRGLHPTPAEAGELERASRGQVERWLQASVGVASWAELLGERHA